MTSAYYTIPDTFFIARSDAPFRSPLFVLREKTTNRKKSSDTLEKLFLASHKIFRVRIRDLGKLDIPLTSHDAQVLGIMLDGLVRAKRSIQKRRG